MNRKQRIVERLTGCGAVIPVGHRMWEAEILEDGYLAGIAFGTSKESATERAKLMAEALKESSR